MDTATLQAFLGWCTVLNFGLLLWWAFFLLFAGDFVFRMHTRFFPVDRGRFNAIHYAGITYFKVTVFMLNVVPFLALEFMVV